MSRNELDDAGPESGDAKDEEITATPVDTAAAQDRESTQTDGRSRFLRDAAVFHGKLMLDGVRDVVLFPVSIVAVAIDLLRPTEPQGRRFYDVLHFARETEKWINLFEAAERAPDIGQPRLNIAGPRLDEFIDDVEGKLRDGYESGELSAKAREAVEQMLDAAKRTMERSGERNGNRHGSDNDQPR